MTYILTFMEKYPDLVSLMKATEHNSSFHAEGSVWTHTCMVYNYCRQTHPDNKILALTALLHDIGKCYVGFEENGKTRFTGHEGYSTFLAISILDHFDLTNEEKIEILHIISLHGVNLSAINAPENLKAFRLADIAGRISTQTRQDYEPRKFLPIPANKEHKVHLLIGLPAAGKSTFANFLGLPRISRDQIIQDMYPDFTYNQAFSTVQSSTALLQLVNQKLERLESNYAKTRTDCVIDMTNTSLSSRRKHMSKFPNAEFHAHVFLPSMETIQLRNTQRKGKIIPEEAYTGMMKSFVMPIKEEGFSRISYIL